METLNDVEVARALLAGGWPRSVLPTAVSVVLGEHRGTVRPTIVSPPNTNGTKDWGLMSINDGAHPEKLKTGDWKNPVDNARMGLMVYKEAGNSFGPWSVYPAVSALYQPRGFAAAQKITGEAIPLGGSTAAPKPSSGASATGGIFDGHNWLRASMVAAGVVLLLIVAMKMTGDNQLSSTTKAIITRGIIK